jgi:hypothetical protein
VGVAAGALVLGVEELGLLIGSSVGRTVPTDMNDSLFGKTKGEARRDPPRD